jgi:hypothetical protein
MQLQNDLFTVLIKTMLIKTTGAYTSLYKGISKQQHKQHMSLLCDLLPKQWQWNLATFLRPTSDPCNNCCRGSVDMPGVHISHPDLSSYPLLTWDLFKCSLSIDIHHYSIDLTEGPFHSKIQTYPVLTFQLEPIHARHFLPAEGPECERFCASLQQVESEVIGLLDPMLEPIVSSSKRLYWVRTQPTSYFKSHVLYSPKDEWTNFYMAISGSTIAICTATVYGNFDQHDHMYMNRLQVTRLPYSQENLKHAQELICQATGDKNFSCARFMPWQFKFLAGNWAVLDASECYDSCSHREGEEDGKDAKKKNSFTSHEFEEMLSRMMQSKCSITANVCRMKQLADMEGSQLFQYLERELGGHSAQVHAKCACSVELKFAEKIQAFWETDTQTTLGFVL